MLSSQAHMNHENFEVLLASAVFETLPKETQELLHSIMSMPTEVMYIEAVTTEGAISEVAMAAEGAAPKVAPIEVSIEVLISHRTPSPRPTPT